MSSLKLSNLLDVLKAKTSRGEVDWTTTADDNTFMVSLPSYAVTLSREQMPRSRQADIIIPPEFRQTHVLLRLHNTAGLVIDELDTATIDTDDQMRSSLLETFDMARRSALHVDDAIDNVIALLNTRQPLQIVSAHYGAGAKKIDVTQKIASQVSKEGTVSVTASNALAGDPAPGVLKTLTVRYRLKGKEDEKTVGEGAVLKLP